jgi:hypothetical protein
VYDSIGRLVSYYDYGGRFVTVSYESNNKTIITKLSNIAYSKFFFDDRKLLVALQHYTAEGKKTANHSAIRDAKGYVLTLKQEYFNPATGAIVETRITNYDYTFDANGNVTKFIITQPGTTDITVEFIYENTQIYLPVTIEASNMIVENANTSGIFFGNPNPKNRLLKMKQNGKDYVGYVFITDGKGRVIYNSTNSLDASRSSFEGSIKYKCD